MEGNVNHGFDDVETSKSKDDASIASDEDKNFAPGVDPFSKALVTIRTTAFKALTSHPSVYSIGLPVLLHGISIAYLVGALVYHFQKDDTEIDWCNNVGLLIIVDSIVYGTILYYFAKAYVWPSISEACSPCLSWVQDKCCCNGSPRAAKFTSIIFYILLIVALGVFLGLDVNTGEEKRFISLLGVAVFMLFGFIFSKYPGHIRWRTVFSGLSLQFIFGLLTVRWETGRNIMSCLGDKVTTFQSYTTNGTAFVYGSLITDPSNGNIFAFATLSVIFFFSFFINILSYYGALQWFIKQLGWLIQVVMGTTVCESVNAAACIFLGMTESPLLFRSYIADLTKSELHAVMCAGWATIAGTVMAAYIAFGVDPAHLIAATVMSAPASLCYAKLFYPETEKSKNTVDTITLEKEEASNVLDAACKGAMSATELVFGIIANIIAFLAFVSFLDGFINWVGVQVGADELSFQYILSKVFIPVSYLMGVDDDQLEDVAILVGTKTVINEFQAYQLMTDMVKEGRLSKRTEAITTYALCGFSNFSSLGILIGGLAALAPSQRSNITSVAMRGFIAANIVCFLTACIAGTLITSLD